MLMLLFYVGDDLYALDSAQVVEVIPRVSLRKIHHAPDYVAGLFNYRGANDCLVKLPDRVELIARIRYHSKAYNNLLKRLKTEFSAHGAAIAR